MDKKTILEILKIKETKSDFIVVMPIYRNRFVLDCEFSIGNFNFFPADYIEYGAVAKIGKISDAYNLANMTAGFSLETLHKNPCMVFPFNIDISAFIANHSSDAYCVDIVRKLSRHADKALNLIKFHLCRLDLPDTLPWQVGTYNRGGYLGAMIIDLNFEPKDNNAFLIARNAVKSQISKGIGLEVTNIEYEELPDESHGEIGGIVSHALDLFSDALEANNDTTKFIRIMTLLEFLAYPDKFQPWKIIKQNIICHIANSQEKADSLRLRFEELTSKTINDEQKGYRTLIVHHGRLLENILPDFNDRAKLFKELDGYASTVIQDMLDNMHMSLYEFQTFRQQKKSKYN